MDETPHPAPEDGPTAPHLPPPGGEQADGATPSVRSRRTLVIAAVIATATAAAVIAGVLAGGSSDVERAVAERVGASASDVSCEKSPRDALPNNFYCELAQDDLTVCYDVYFDREAGAFETPGLFRVGVARGGCDDFFPQL